MGGATVWPPIIGEYGVKQESPVVSSTEEAHHGRDVQVPHRQKSCSWEEVRMRGGTTPSLLVALSHTSADMRNKRSNLAEEFGKEEEEEQVEKRRGREVEMRWGTNDPAATTTSSP